MDGKTFLCHQNSLIESNKKNNNKQLTGSMHGLKSGPPGWSQHGDHWAMGRILLMVKGDYWYPIQFFKNKIYIQRKFKRRVIIGQPLLL